MSTLRLRIFDGTRQPFPLPAQFLVTITDGNQKQLRRDFYSANDLSFNDLPFYNNFGDNYSVLVSLDGYKQAGFTPVKLSDTFLTTLDIMLIPNSPELQLHRRALARGQRRLPVPGRGRERLRRPAAL